MLFLILMAVLFIRVMGFVFRISWKITWGIISAVAVVALAIFALPVLGYFLAPIIAMAILLAFVISLAVKTTRT